MSSLNIDTLFEEADKKVLNRLKMFDDILVQIHNKMKVHSKNKWFYCTYQIPEFLIGKPPPMFKLSRLGHSFLSCTYTFMHFKSSFQ